MAIGLSKPGTGQIAFDKLRLTFKKVQADNQKESE
jgi:hypothetical protein